MSRSGVPNKAQPKRERMASDVYADVWLFDDALREWKTVNAKRDKDSRRTAKRLATYFPRFAEKGPQGFSDEMFKTVGRIKATGGTEPLICEFKSYQFRLYGIIREFRGKRSFIGLVCDSAKKNNKANPNILKRAANAAANI